MTVVNATVTQLPRWARPAASAGRTTSAVPGAAADWNPERPLATARWTPGDAPPFDVGVVPLPRDLQPWTGGHGVVASTSGGPTFVDTGVSFRGAVNAALDAARAPAGGAEYEAQAVL